MWHLFDLPAHPKLVSNKLSKCSFYSLSGYVILFSREMKNKKL